MNEKILVTGANGYIGVKVVNQLIQLGYDVIATDLSNSNIRENVKFIKSNIFEIKDS